MGNLTQSFDRGHVKDNKKLVIKINRENLKYHPNRIHIPFIAAGDFELDFHRKLEQFKKAAILLIAYQLYHLLFLLD